MCDWFVARVSFVQNQSGENFFTLFYGICAIKFQRKEPIKYIDAINFSKKSYLSKKNICQNRI